MINMQILIKTTQNATRSSFIYKTKDEILSLKCVHEIFEGDCIIKPCFDIDLPPTIDKDEYLHKFEDECSTIFPDGKLAIAYRQDSNKLSFHISIINYDINRFAMSNYCKKFTVEGIDMNIYNSKMHSLRLPFSVKSKTDHSGIMNILKGEKEDFINQYWRIPAEFHIREHVSKKQTTTTSMTSSDCDQYLKNLNLDV